MSLGGGFNSAVNEAVNAAIDDVSIIIIDIDCMLAMDESEMV